MWYFLLCPPAVMKRGHQPSCSRLLTVLLSEVTWSSWLVSERVQLSVVSWKSACEEKTRSLVWNGRQPGTQLIELSVERQFCTGVVTRCPECRRWRISLGRGRCQNTASGDCNRLKTLVCALQWSVKCSSRWCTQGVNKSSLSIHTVIWMAKVLLGNDSVNTL
jgi:hypothetical protein